jgi:kynurenine formamidase
LVLRFDWSDHWGQAEYYSDYPYLSADACAALIQGGLRLLALDTPSPDDPRNGPGGPVDSPNHKMLLEAGVTVVEYLTNLRALTGPWTTLIALPLKVVGADGSPARVVAVDGIISGVVQPETT